MKELAAVEKNQAFIGRFENYGWSGKGEMIYIAGVMGIYISAATFVAVAVCILSSRISKGEIGHVD